MSDGSSPRMRGTRRRKHKHEPLYRFIPADAGNTDSWKVAVSIRSVHPRGCGEHPQAPLMMSSSSGSSPRMRGTLQEMMLEYIESRFIPADAGNTTTGRPSSCIGAVHPRGCGEHGKCQFIHGHSYGSSPRMRGTPVSSVRPSLLSRFIPADAGNTCSNWETCRKMTVHPRGCGEHDFIVCGIVHPVGSSPRMRGTLRDIMTAMVLDRFIPADAGNTHREAFRGRGTAVHPRGCGEHDSSLIRFVAAHGSSPRMRGTPAKGAAALTPDRFIPADAGNTN